mgnify:CR=1 FL=1
MLKYNFKYELKQLLRSRWIQMLSVLLLLLFGFAINNGTERIEKRNTELVSTKAETDKEYEGLYSKLDSIEKGLEPTRSWLDDPILVGYYYPRVADMPANSMTFVATGQSDMYSHFQKPNVYGSSLMKDYTEMTSPVQLLFGSFDLAFVIIYLLPLLIIAFSYNVLSSERESGTLRLLGSQSISVRTWLLQKLMIRFFWLAALVLLSLTVLILVFNKEAFTNMGVVFSFYGLILAYMLFWFALAFLVSLWIGTSAKNAVSLLGFWIFFVLLIPSVLNQLGTTLYPMPSRTLLINDVRTMQAEVNKRQDEILDSYLRDHPEYAVNDTTQQRNFWHRYMASQKLMREELQPVISNFEQQMQKQQKWVGKFKWLSPTVITQESLNEMAGTSTADYADFRKQVENFEEEWRNHFIPLLYNNEKFKKEDVANLPDFKYQPRERTASSMLLILLIAAIVFAVGFAIAKNKKSKLIII